MIFSQGGWYAGKLFLNHKGRKGILSLHNSKKQFKKTLNDDMAC
jgi:hypothetical protein